jgi:hypothetical protein
MRALPFTSSMKRLVVGVLLASTVGLNLVSPIAYARLSDMLKRPPVLYLPSQLLPGKEATFSVKAKPGMTVTLYLSTQSAGFSLPDGRPLNVGDPVVTEETVVPETGVATFKLQLPEMIGDPGMKRYAQAVVWSEPDKLDAEVAEIFSPVGVTVDNSIEVGVLPDEGTTMLLPSGNNEMSGLMRGMAAWSDVRGSDRKKQLIDDGGINQNRQLDQTINVAPNPLGLR